VGICNSVINILSFSRRRESTVCNITMHPCLRRGDKIAYKGNILIFSLLLLTACGDKLMLQKADFTKLNGWHQDRHTEALVSFKKSCKKFKTMPEAMAIHTSGIGGKYGDWKRLCNRADNIDAKDAVVVRKFFENNFTPYLASNWGKDSGIFTGYYEIELKGSRTRHGEYQYPIYARPADIKDGIKYYSREQIEGGALQGKGLEIAWANDPVRLFFLHVQGSGRIKLDDGSVMRVGYNGKNGYKYTSIGRYMIDKGYIEEKQISAQGIKKWLYESPHEIQTVLNQNDSYVFFRELSGDGPIGGQGVPLTPMRSLAVDKRFVPYGAPVWVDIALNDEGLPGNSLKKLMVAQDTGAAIRGPVRGDVFFGYGERAEHMAGHQNNKGKYYILLPKDKS